MCDCIVWFLPPTQKLALALFDLHVVPVSPFLHGHNSLSLVVQPIFHPPYQPLNELIHHQEVQESVSKALLNSRYTPPLPFPFSTVPVTS